MDFGIIRRMKARIEITLNFITVKFPQRRNAAGTFSSLLFFLFSLIRRFSCVTPVKSSLESSLSTSVAINIHECTVMVPVVWITVCFINGIRHSQTELLRIMRFLTRPRSSSPPFSRARQREFMIFITRNNIVHAKKIVYRSLSMVGICTSRYGKAPPRGQQEKNLSISHRSGEYIKPWVRYFRRASMIGRNWETEIKNRYGAHGLSRNRIAQFWQTMITVCEWVFSFIFILTVYPPLDLSECDIMRDGRCK